MAINLPNLDNLTWKDLTDEARSLIPAWAPAWTNHNVSDPGITLMELFAYISEQLIYRANRISDANKREFLKLIKGPSASLGDDLREAVLTTVRDLRQLRRAVTANDFETLTLAANKHLKLAAGEKVARVKCLPEQNLENEYLSARFWHAPGHVTVVVVSNGQSQPTPELLGRVRQALEPARLLGTRVHVVGPRYVKVGVRLTVIPRKNVIPETLKENAIKLLQNFFDPLTGGFDKKGWPFGRHVYVSDLYQLLDELPGVDYIKRTLNPATGDEMDELLVASSETHRLKLNALSEFEAVLLQPYELVDARIDPANISVLGD